MPTEIKILTEKKRQTFDGFGVSGAWWAQDVGGWDEPDPDSGLPKRERVAQLLFDKEQGIGVGAYRYNLGGGSMQSGRGKFSNHSRRAESFDAGDIGKSEYDWSRDENAVWMMNAAVRYGADEVVLFVNSPPERLTRNHKSHLDKPLRTNLPKKNDLPFAKYCLDVAEHFVEQGVPVKYISPVNEPVWVWTGGQEGCHYRPGQVRALMRVFAAELEKRPKLRGVRLAGAENGDLRWFNKTYCRVMLGDEIVRRNVDSVDTHSYFITPPRLKPFIGNRLAYMRRYKKWMDKHYPGVKLKVSEWTHMKGGRDYGMDSALEQAKIMLEDITVLDAAAWQLWIAVSNVDFCDGLIYQFDEDRTFKLTKRYYAFGNYSKFVEKGSVRVETECGDAELKTLAFVGGDKTVVVVINPTDAEKTVCFGGGSAVTYVTDDREDLAERAVDLSCVRISGRSVNTVVMRNSESGMRN